MTITVRFKPNEEGTETRDGVVRDIPKRRLSRDGHVIINASHSGRFECLHCGNFYLPPTPIEVWAYISLSKGFVGEHRSCAPGPDGPLCMYCTKPGHRPEDCPRLVYEGDPRRWISGPDAGASSRTIFGALLGYGYATETIAAIPYDPDDFGRCYRFFTAFPDLRRRLSEVAAKHPNWAPFVREWDNLSALYEQEQASGRGKELYNAIRRLVDEAEAAP